MSKIGIAAGGGSLPVECAKKAKEKGYEVIIIAVEGEASKELEKYADKIYWIKFGQFAKLIYLIVKERLNKLILIGKISRTTIHKKTKYDPAGNELFNKAKDKKDYSILKQATKYLAKVGTEVIDPSEFLSHLLVSKGNLTKKSYEKEFMEEIEFGIDVAKKSAAMDIGQTVIVKDKAIVAVEAMEGTDNVIKRAYEVAGEGCIMIKVARPEQDMRWDVPTVGIKTIELLKENKFKALAVEAGKMYVMDQSELIKYAEENNIIVVGI
ncbi:MAG: UDP-2,3-diacylglucosamine diphosphatase LpxI [Candidatus Omnitrophica bacterium]|nr:UDP-2,3-diacylglucosamine diphosphatase LpxI [Candidatus Omnitrophota bacterium]